MARRDKPKRAKAYRPRPTTQYGGLHVIAGRIVKANPMSDVEQIEVLTDYYAAIDAMAQGRAEFKHFEKLVYAVNVTRVLADMGFGDEYEELIQQGMTAVQKIKDRHTATGKWGLDGDGRKALYTMEDLHRAQLEIATQGEITVAIQEMWRRINAGIKFKLPAAA
jgi:hypothetical protein